MADTGILIVSHSKNLAQGLFDLISQVAANVAISYNSVRKIIEFV